MGNKVFTRSVVSFKRRPTQDKIISNESIGIEFIVVGEEKRMIYGV